jgi:glycosyltransferase involved in cell wall biosynthesis
MGFNQSAKHRIAYRLLRPLFSQVQTVSNEVRESCVRREGFAPDRVVTIYNGVDLQEVAAANGAADLRRSLGLENASHIISTVGNIRWIKGTDILIQVAAKICARYPRAVFLIPGKVLEPEYYNTIVQTMRSLGLTENVRFLGSSDRVFSMLKMSNVFCLLSRSEGFSNALLEAMASGLPCVVTDVGGNKEALEDAQSGFLVPNEDVKAAAEKILALLEDPSKAVRMGRRGREIIEQKFTTDVMVNRLARFYDTLLQRAH